MKMAFFLIVSFTVLQNSIFPQSDPVANTSEKFNKRGVIDNQDFSVKGKEIISAFDGNVLIKYSTPVILPNDLSGDFTVIYNPNIEHRMFRNPDDRNGNMVNSPEWILGFKGFALQTLNFENNFFIGHDEGFEIEYKGEEIPMLISGYHYTNKINPDQDHDYIKILMADGTVKVLYNIKKYEYEGIYVEPGINNRGFAIVEPFDQEFNRKVYYKPGDGLTYFFEEEIVDYYDFTNSASNDPRILYLKKIFNKDDQNGDFIEFEYNVVVMDVQKGRLPFSYLKSNRRDSDVAGNELDVFYGYSQGGTPG